MVMMLTICLKCCGNDFAIASKTLLKMLFLNRFKQISFVIFFRFNRLTSC